MSSPSRPRTSTVPAADEVAAGLRLSTTRLARRLRTEAEIGLTPSLLSALAELEGIAPPSVTKIVAKLEEQGLLERIPDPSDRRVRRVRTTRSGEELLARSRARKNAWLAHRLDVLDDEDLLVLDRAAHLIDELLRADRPTAGGAT